MAEEAFTPLEKLISQGKELGYAGDDLRKFVEAQQRAERDARAERRQADAEQQEGVRRKVEAEIELKAKEIELLRLKAEQGQSDTASVSLSPGYRGRTPAPKPQLPRFSESTDSIDAYISRFELHATNQDWPEQEWAMALSALLTGKALYIFSTLPREQQNDYDRVREALLKGYDLTEEGFRRQFRQARIQGGETYVQFGVRLEHYLTKWVELSGIDENFAGLRELLLREQMLNNCSPELTIHLRERNLPSFSKMLAAVEVYREARAGSRQPNAGVGQKLHRHNGEGSDGLSRKPINQGQVPRQGPDRNQVRQSDRRECFLCHKMGHIARECRSRPQKTAALTEVTDKASVEGPDDVDAGEMLLGNGWGRHQYASC